MTEILQLRLRNLVAAALSMENVKEDLRGSAVLRPCAVLARFPECDAVASIAVVVVRTRQHWCVVYAQAPGLNK